MTGKNGKSRSDKSLDYSEKVHVKRDHSVVESFRQQFIPSDQELKELELSDLEPQQVNEGFFNKLKGKFSSLKEGSLMNSDQLQKVTDEFMFKLIEKNVSQETAS